MGCTVNDIIIGGLSAACMDYKEKYSPDTPNHDLAAALWISMVPITKAFDPETPENPLQFGNGNLSAVTLRLPGTERPENELGWVREIKKRVDALKNSPFPY